MNWTAGWNRLSSPGQEEPFGDNWWMAAHRLYQLLEDWARDDDHGRRIDDEHSTLAWVRHQWESRPPAHDQPYTLAVDGHSGTRIFFLMDRP